MTTAVAAVHRVLSVRLVRPVGEHRPALDLHRGAGRPQGKDQISRSVTWLGARGQRPCRLEGLLQERDRLICSAVHGSSIREVFGVREAPNTEHQTCTNVVTDAEVRVVPVSYTHLRAHETRHDLVCRLL